MHGLAAICNAQSFSVIAPKLAGLVTNLLDECRENLGWLCPISGRAAASQAVRQHLETQPQSKITPTDHPISLGSPERRVSTFSGASSHSLSRYGYCRRWSSLMSPFVDNSYAAVATTPVGPSVEQRASSSLSPANAPPIATARCCLLEQCLSV